MRDEVRKRWKYNFFLGVVHQFPDVSAHDFSLNNTRLTEKYTINIIFIFLLFSFSSLSVQKQ